MKTITNKKQVLKLLLFKLSFLGLSSRGHLQRNLPNSLTARRKKKHGKHVKVRIQLLLRNIFYDREAYITLTDEHEAKNSVKIWLRKRFRAQFLPEQFAYWMSPRLKECCLETWRILMTSGWRNMLVLFLIGQQELETLLHTWICQSGAACSPGSRGKRWTDRSLVKGSNEKLKNQCYVNFNIFPEMSN